MRYAHLADLHLGSWRDQRMRDLSTNVFLKAIDECVAAKVDFILFAGDLFNTALPSLDTLKIVTKKLKELNTLGVPLYVIPGSHDFSPSGKTMIDVLENAGLMINVCKGSIDTETKKLQLRFTVDPKTGAKITGMLGRKGQLDQKFYEELDRNVLEKENGYKIFLFHTTVAELLPKDLSFIDSQPLSYFPTNFDYYAGGHIHCPAKVEYGRGVATYTGALFPNNFAELEKFGKGGYYLVEDGNVEWKALELMKHEKLVLNCGMKSPDVVTFDILNAFANKDLTNTLVTIRLKGMLQQGRVTDINFKHIFETLYAQGAYFVMRNTAKINIEEFEEISLAKSDPAAIEEDTIKEHLQQMSTFNVDTEYKIIKSLLHSLHTTKKEGEKSSDFLKRIEDEVGGVLQYTEQ